MADERSDDEARESQRIHEQAEEMERRAQKLLSQLQLTPDEHRFAINFGTRVINFVTVGQLESIGNDTQIRDVARKAAVAYALQLLSGNY